MGPAVSLGPIASERYILPSNTASLYSCVMLGRGCVDARRFTENASGAIRDFMVRDGYGFVYRRFLAPTLDVVRFAKPFGSPSHRVHERLGDGGAVLARIG